MGAQRRKRLLALILTVILLTEPGWGFFTGIREVWGNDEDVPILENIVSGNGIQEDSASENGISQNSISEDDISDSNISGNEILNGEIWEDALPEEGISQNEVSGNIISGNIYDSNSDNRISIEKISDNCLSENRFQESELSENRISADNLEKTAVTYKVTFDSQKGSTVKAQMVEQGARAKKPADPVRSKYIFSGWYKGNRKYDFKTPVTANIKLTAKWTKVTVGKSKIKKLTNPSKGVLKLQLKKAAGARGYQIQVSTDKNFKKKNETFLSSGTTVQIRDREKKKTYYVKARAYKLDSKGGNVYGKYSGKKALKIAKGIQKVDPSATAGAINSVALISKKTVRIKAKVPNYVKSVDSYYYLFHLGCSAGKVAKGAVPDAKIRKRSSFTMDTSLDHNTPSSKLQTKFVLAVKTKKIGTYTIICTPQFISNPEKLAAYNYAFPRTSTKKGLQVNPAYIEDAVELGVKHTGYNICLDDLIAAPGQENDIWGISFSHNGKTYWFNRGVVESIDHTLDQFKQKGIVVSAILLMRWRADLAYLVPSAAREPGHSYYALNTSEAKARNHWDAVFTFLAQRYAAKSLISNWILGNEVNNYGTYHYTGSNVLANNVKIYTDAYRLAYIALRSVYGKARVYISLDQVWTYLAAGSHMGKQFLERFASNWNTYGKMGNFHIAFHPYPAPLEDPAFWTNSKGLVTDNVNSPCISMWNLRVFTNYVKQNWGSGTRIILSEQGFTSKRYGADVPQLQAAAMAYAYYLAEFNTSIDAFILHRHVDHQAEEAMGLYLGLWTNNGDRTDPAVMGKKKYAWDIFKKMDTSKGKAATKFALPYIGASSWKAIVPGYDKSRFS